ncbi:MATH and LRR domain-containing protein PFE0570w [Cucumis sativus]|uniref:Uncharacterized protein n=1 Tax=Cucumis sativus TaxID=3659 RepID=B0F829_CUCSA|nr:MATH and LRR domain-containing protein PFE0570w [Cucumis sativus]ABY56099.1 hypothetical protein [Cucumis sativus]KGN61571.1 hypothetical protein Csa_006733 [Cucumis sativus]
MGCFLACFGFHKHRKKRRSPPDGLVIGDQIHLSYEPLDSSQITNCHTNQKLEVQNSKPRDRAKEQPWVKIRKKVSFNLNVQTYEPVPDYDYFLESDEEVKNEEHCQETTARTDSTPLQNKAFTASNSGKYPQNHRYQNCEDSYDDEEDDDSGNGDSDLDDSEIDENHDENKDEFRSCALENNSVVERRQQVHSVLKPVENLTQWRTAKAKAGSFTKHQVQNKNKTSTQAKSPAISSSNTSSIQPQLKSRSNLCLPDTQMQENDLVHSSLSDWLVRTA